MANRNFASGGKIYSMHVRPVLLDCNFVVDSTNANGLGIRSLKGPCISAVYMHTSATPAAGNPNPPAGYIYVKLADNYNRYLGGFSGAVSPTSGTPLTSVVANSVYIITSLGTATTAQWVAKGLPIGVTPAVGVSFVASASGTIGGSAAVMAPLSTGSGIDHVEVIGDPNLMLANSAQPSNGGGYMILACFLNNTLTQPANGSVIGLSFYFNDSSVLIQGE
jgi:hypothetical protein